MEHRPLQPSADAVRTPRALVLAGGWEGHDPERTAEFAERHLLRGFEVVQSRRLDVLSEDVLSGFDLLVPIWTFGELNEGQERALLAAVEEGMGLLAWHGFASAFLGCRAHKFLLGGQFVAHPGGDAVAYSVRFDARHALTRGLADARFTSEQYYLLVDPGVTVLATTQMAGEAMPWTAGVRMPQAWVRDWGRGRVAYVAPGHTLEVLMQPSILELLRRCAWWARRGSTLQRDGTPSITLKVGPAGVTGPITKPAR